MDRDELFKFACKSAESIFSATHSLTPAFIFVSVGGESGVVLCPWGDGREKAATLEKVRQMFKEKNVVRYAMLSEAWMVEAKNSEDALTGPAPSDRPDRIEILQVMVVEPGHDAMIRTWRIVREDGDPTLELMEEKATRSVEGRMVDLITTPVVSH